MPDALEETPGRPEFPHTPAGIGADHRHAPGGGHHPSSVLADSEASVLRSGRADARPLSTIDVNGQAWPWRPALTLDALLLERAEDGQAVATAVNGRFVPRPQRENTLLAAGDSILLFSPIVGG